MATIADILNESGLTVQAVTSGRSVDPIIRDLYSALDNGAKYAYIFTGKADDSMLALFASAEEVVNGEAFVSQDDNGYDVGTLRRKVNYRSKLNVGKDGNPRAKVTLGAVTLSHNVNDADGNPVGFRVNAK